jgi:uncharacterized membrane protein YozB (DUF420 family)
MDPKLVYWTGALVDLGVALGCAAQGWRLARRRQFASHRRWMLAACWLVAAFLASYVLKVFLLGREQLELWDARYVRALEIHETFVTAMLACGIGALVQARRLGLPRGPDSLPIEPRRLARGVRTHRWLGRTAAVASGGGFVTAGYVLWGMYERAGWL